MPKDRASWTVLFLVASARFLSMVAWKSARRGLKASLSAGGSTWLTSFSIYSSGKSLSCTVSLAVAQLLPTSLWLLAN